MFYIVCWVYVVKMIKASLDHNFIFFYDKNLTDMPPLSENSQLSFFHFPPSFSQSFLACILIILAHDFKNAATIFVIKENHTLWKKNVM